ncbi:hypothetical protein KAFR_0J01820 [Kazachstania africana CBS 2517]|uniref:Dolichyl-diphosphooligosaccharide--protein glycosyltransferase subunit 3 n=1 Tax=Kazachstania africana (strain ATCC 22294 / BCRC 22015 / CBS 2517 / CECT 1963 / NBRC 1671 / NRRL Y-8276) TaxID=1071382 RepID=H2B0U6_KAZAF|nr:hypothetical protein KAFR_0J01820 [Kazachstania africana CBS 2517]CCF60246.1 hypothetical protein KAFR_0J01820 [Kazachstania africana CBS 2517]
MRLGNQISVILALLSVWFSVVTAAVQESLLQEAQKNSNKVITLTNENYQNVLGGPRDSYILALLTSTAPEVNCVTCIELESEYKTIANSWFADHPDGVSGSKSLYFAKANIETTQFILDVFTVLGIEQVPRLLLFSPGGDIKDFELLDIPLASGMERVFSIITAVKSQTGINDYFIHEPIDWSSFFITGFTTFAVIFLLRKNQKIAVSFLTSRITWALISVAFIILMLGGSMFNKMRGQPLAGQGKNGEIVYFLAGDFQNQFAIETQVIVVLYGILTSVVVFLVLAVPKISSYYSNSARRTTVVALAAISSTIILYMFFSALTGIFKIKSASYPFTLMKLTSFFS